MFKQQFENLKKTVSSTVEDGKGVIASSVDSVANTAKEVKTSVSSGVDNVTNKVNDTIDNVNDTVDSVTATVEVVGDRISSGVDTITSTFSVLSKIVTSTVGFVASFAMFFVELGITIVAITAPVPTVIGAAIIWLMAELVFGVANGISNDINSQKNNKRAARAIKTLKKYGAIPKTATIKTDFVNLEISSEDAKITGTILQGEFKDKDIDSLTEEEINRLIKFAPDTQLKDLFEGYLVFRKNKDKAEIKMTNE